MELIYQVKQRIPKSLNSLYNYKSNNEQTLCSISRGNILAFCSLIDVNDLLAENWGYHVLIADLCCPWFSYKIFSSAVTITVLEWNESGDLLLIGNKDGLVQVLKCNEYVLNDWKIIHSLNLKEESILLGTFFHPGSRFTLNFDSNNDNYIEKFHEREQFLSSFTQFGKQPAEGCLILTKTGLLSAFMLSCNNNKEIVIQNKFLNASRMHLVSATVSFTKSGSFRLAVCNGKNKALVRVYEIKITSDENDENFNDNYFISIESFMSFHLVNDTICDNNRIEWLNKQDSDCLLIIQKTSLELWQLCEQTIQISSLLGVKEPFSMKKYALKHQMKISDNINKNRALFISDYYIFLENFHGNIQYLSKDDLSIIGTISLNNLSNWHINCISITQFHFLLITVDSFGQISVFKLRSKINEDILNKTTSIVNIIEYCLITGYDWFEIVLHLSNNTIIEQIIEQFIDNFKRQPISNQQYYFLNYLSILSSLYRCSGQIQKANDLNCLVMLHSISTAFKVLLRPSQLSSNDQSPADSLANVMNAEVHCDVDKVLCHLEAKEFTVEPSTLQSLQHLIQWVADVALVLLAKLSEQKSISSNYFIREALPILRELLVIIRIWGLLRQSCLPVFMKSADNLDVLSLLFRLLGKLAQNPDCIDDNLIEECLLLQSPIFIPNLTQVNSESLYTNLQQFNFPLMFEHNVEPEFITNLSQSCLQSHYSDCIRHMSISMPPVVVKQCFRCGFITGNYVNTKTAATRSWDLRWHKSCVCNGPWRLRFFI